MNELYRVWRTLDLDSPLFAKNLERRLHIYFESTTEYITDTLEHLILFFLVYFATCVLLYVFIVAWKTFPYTKSINCKRVLFITSHPDDEVMFFGPTILHLMKQPDVQVYLICLSTGKNYGMGTVRKNELYKSCEILGIKEENVTILTHTNLPDKIDHSWPTDVVSKLVLRHVEQFDIDVVITFDRYGISKHPNHCSIYFSVADLIMEQKMPKTCSVYVLETVDVLRKYWLIFDLPLTYLMSRIRYVVDCKDRRLIHKAMWQHKSQLVWYRLLYMFFSRYMLINSLQKMDLADVELDLVLDD